MWFLKKTSSCFELVPSCGRRRGLKRGRTSGNETMLPNIDETGGIERCASCVNLLSGHQNVELVCKAKQTRLGVLLSGMRSFQASQFSVGHDHLA